jgi:hypothetical protein
VAAARRPELFGDDESDIYFAADFSPCTEAKPLATGSFLDQKLLGRLFWSSA